MKKESLLLLYNFKKKIINLTLSIDLFKKRKEKKVKGMNKTITIKLNRKKESLQ